MPHPYHHLRPRQVPIALAELHRSLDVGARVELVLPPHMEPGRAHDLVTGAGFGGLEGGANRPCGAPVVARRERTLADTVGTGMRLLVCGLNPSLYAADAGVAFARPGNRFWSAALAAGLVTLDRDPMHALNVHGVGMTDLVKRATVTATEVTTDEYRDGLARVERLCAWLRPGAVCFVGLAGWRAVVARHATPGLQPTSLGGTPVYVMPSTSGRNARVGLHSLATHFQAAAALA